jgi:hypothetical protein
VVDKMARCPSCNKFVPIEMGEPDIEVSEPDVVEADDDKDALKFGSVDVLVRLVKTCEECGEELAEAYPEDTIDLLEDHDSFTNPDEHEITIDTDWDPTDTGGGRYAKRYYGVDVTFHISCKCGWKDEVVRNFAEAASYFDEL